MSFSPASWNLGVDARLDFVTKNLQSLCRDFGKRPKARPRRSYGTDGILLLVQLKRHLRRSVRESEHSKTRAVLRLCCKLWKKEASRIEVLQSQIQASDVAVAVHWHALSRARKELRGRATPEQPALQTKHFAAVEAGELISPTDLSARYRLSLACRSSSTCNRSSERLAFPFTWERPPYG